MGWRFRRSVQVIPGVRLNFTNRGISTTVGVKGAHVTLGRGRATTTVGIPGTGISYSATARDHPQPTPAPPSRGWLLFLGVAALVAAIACYFSPFPVVGHLFLLAGMAALLTRRRARAAEALPVGLAQERDPSTRLAGVDAPSSVIQPSMDPAEVAARVARFKQAAREHDQRLAAERRQEQEVAAADAARTRILQDKLRVLLFLARDDGAVRAQERDVMVAYLRSQPGLEDANDSWLKTMHTKLDRDSDDTAIEAVARLGSAGEIDQAMINATEALVKLTKRISPAQLNVLTMLRHERARGPWQPSSG